jgi:CHAT domain-containing protein/tetratricopeptide (TPR) repeat protein
LSPNYSIFANNNDSLGLETYKHGIEFIYVDFDSSIHFFEKAIPILLKEENWNEYIDCHNYLAVLQYNIGNIEEGILYTNKAIELNNIIFEEPNVLLSGAVNNLGAFNTIKGKYKLALENYSQSLSIDQKINSSSIDIASTFQNIGVTYQKMGDYDQALIYYKRADNLFRDSIKEVHVDYATLLKKMGYCYKEKGNQRSASEYYNQSLSVLNKLENGEYVLNQKIYLFQDISETFLNFMKLDSAEYYIRQASNIQRKNKLKEHFRTNEILFHIYKKRGKYNKAKKEAELALQIAKKQYSFERKSRLISRVHRGFGILEYEFGNYKSALKHFQHALIRVAYNFEDTSIYKNPKVDKVVSKITATRAFYHKALALYKYYEETRDVKDLKMALATFKLAAKMVEKTRQEILTTGSKEQLAGEALSIYEGGILVAKKLYELTQKKEYLEDAFAFTESNKGILLLESLQAELARNYGGLPDSLREKERDLRIDIAFYERQINEEKQKGNEADLDKIKIWEENLFSFNSEYQDLVELLEEAYPKYFHLKYNTKLASLAAIQENLDTKSALVEYFVGEENIFRFTILKSDIQLDRIEKAADFSENILQLTSSLQDPAQISKTYPIYLHQAHQVYQTYLASALNQMPDDIDRLILILDDVMAYIPFEILLRTQPAQGIQSFKPSQLDYLFEDYSISYSYSSTLLLENWKTPKRSYKGNFIGFAPSFSKPMAEAVRDCASGDLYSLKCSVNEIDAIQDLMGGETISDASANLPAFEQEAPGYRILHLATHACSDESNPKFSKIYFSDEAISNIDISTLNLPAELAVLSACNTGSGKLIKGEGLMSLSKGFINAGCPSTLMSLWSVDDCTTSDIMLRFYEKLKKGLAKDEALKQAKIEYLNAADSPHQHPYYWAAFVQMGNFQAIDFPSPRLYWLLGSLAVGLIFFAFRFKK